MSLVSRLRSRTRCRVGVKVPRSSGVKGVDIIERVRSLDTMIAVEVEQSHPRGLETRQECYRDFRK